MASLKRKKAPLDESRRALLIVFVIA